MITYHNVFNVWPKTTLLLPVWPRDAKRLDTTSIVTPLVISSEFNCLLNANLNFYSRTHSSIQTSIYNFDSQITTWMSNIHLKFNQNWTLCLPYLFHQQPSPPQLIHSASCSGQNFGVILNSPLIPRIQSIKKPCWHYLQNIPFLTGTILVWAIITSCLDSSVAS